MAPSNVHLLHPASAPLAGFLRVGHTGHHKLEALHAADRLGFCRLVFDAAHVIRNADFLRAQRMAGREIVIDLNVAETAMPGRFASAVGKLPWGNPDRPWTPGDFGATRNDDFAKRFAQFVADIGPSAVLAPVHVAEGEDEWRSIDIRATERLRVELDRVGGKDIAIDHQVIISAREFRDNAKRAAALGGIGDVPVQNLWVRISGFGATSTGAGTRNMIEAARSLQALSLPLVLDMAGGFAGLSALAFGAFGGISHGAGQRESFDLAQWRKPPNGKGGGTAQRAYVPDLDRYLNDEQLRAFFAVRGTKARFACADTSCCKHGHEDMLENGHFITQRSLQLESLSKVPPARRAENFLLRQLDPAVRSTRQASKLKFGDPGIQKIVFDAKGRLTRLRDALGALHEADGGDAPISASPLFRGSRPGLGGISVIQGGRP